MIKTIVLGGAAPLIASLSLNVAWPDVRWVNFSAHAGLEAIGTLSSLIIAAFILILLRNGQLERSYVWLATGLASMGMLDGVHAFLHGEHSFDWTRSLGNLVGGSIFAAVWLPDRFTPGRNATAVVIGSTVCAATVAVCYPLLEHLLPPMVRDGEFTGTAALFNVLGGIGFLAASVYILNRDTGAYGNAKVAFSSHAFLFGVASILFEVSTRWDMSWWLWHAISTSAYIFVFKYFFDIFHSHLQSLESTSERLSHAFGNVFEATTEGILFIGHDGRICAANPAAQTMFKLDEAEAKDLSLADVLPHILDAEPGNEEQNQTQLAVRPDGSTFQAEATLTDFRTGGSYAHFVIIRDISVRKQAEERVHALVTALQASKEELERSNAELDTFAYVASHDLRSPLRTIQNAVIWLEEDLSEHFTEDTRDSMDIILRRTRRMEQLLEDLLLHSRIGRNTPQSPMISGEDLIRRIQDLAQQREGFSIQADDSFASLTVEKTPLVQVLTNLVSNAIKHHDKTTGTVSLSVSQTADMLTFTVTDDGPGIPERYQAKVFDMFTTLQPRDKVEGSGMGLAIVRKYAEVAGGTVSVLSEGRGCRFTLTWPKIPPSQQEPSSQ
ncbi:ATP-binding protein [Phaeobacter sp. B1627]|uniref:sensor histidine kinase n=1 Tax=Phaeobacter sp. B1627 TaxID=2583809 RepID=UPI00159EC03B|nr:PAS domain-containing sensor histidine kinase [Phaeobacter sp. B1627]